MGLDLVGKRSRHVDLPCFIGCNLDPPNKVVLVG